MQIVSITVAIALSLIAYSSSTNIISSWESSLPEKAPNNFIFNLFEDDKENLKDFLESRDIELLLSILLQALDFLESEKVRTLIELSILRGWKTYLRAIKLFQENGLISQGWGFPFLLK